MNLSSEEETAAQALLAVFGADTASLKLLHRSVGIVVESVRGDSPLILKIISSEDRDTRPLQARLDWIHYLHENGLKVPNLVESQAGRWIEQVESGGTLYTAYAYHKIPLTEASRIDWQDLALPPRLGQVMGGMHRLSKTYRPGPGQPALGQWGDGDWIRHPETAFHPSQAAVMATVIHLRETIARFPQDSNRCGILHDDLHTGNVFRLNGDLAVLDFDMCHYGWFAADLASALLFRVWIAPEKQRRVNEARPFLEDVLEGYQTENDLPRDWQEMLPIFLKWREISLFWSDYGQLDFSQGLRDDLPEYLFESIAQEKPFFEMDFRAFR